MTERDIKLLWGNSGNRCAICKTELSQDKKLSSEKFPLGEQAHIIGEKDSAARGKSNLSDTERDGYSNRILLCPNHHTEIDKDEQYYSVERLHLIKQQHELWVKERLSERADGKKQVADQIYSAIIDAAVKYCDFPGWNRWVSEAGYVYQRWHQNTVSDIDRFEDCIHRAIWPGSNPELENALKTLSLALSKARETFMQHCEYGRYGSMYSGVKFYSLTWHEDQSVYHRLLKEYKAWVFEFSFWLWIATKAANWICEVVRKGINPMFFAIEGRFVSCGGIGGDSIPEFTAAEKQNLPDKIEALIKDYRKNHPNIEIA